jgi:hypothetical protein
LLEIGPTADHKAVEYSHRAPGGNQTIDEVATDEAGTAGYEIDGSVGQFRFPPEIMPQRKCADFIGTETRGFKHKSAGDRLIYLADLSCILAT